MDIARAYNPELSNLCSKVVIRLGRMGIKDEGLQLSRRQVVRDVREGAKRLQDHVPRGVLVVFQPLGRHMVGLEAGPFEQVFPPSHLVRASRVVRAALIGRVNRVVDRIGREVEVKERKWVGGSE